MRRDDDQRKFAGLGRPSLLRPEQDRAEQDGDQGQQERKLPAHGQRGSTTTSSGATLAKTSRSELKSTKRGLSS